MFASKSERKVRYSIRKFSVGVASVVVASLFLGGVVHAEGVGGGNNPTVTSSGQDRLQEYRQQLIKELEDTDLSSDRKADYRKQIETETNTQKLMEIENNFHNESRIDHDQAVDQASTSLSMYMTSLLNELDTSAPGFGDILQQAQGIVREYQEKIGGASDREKIEKLQQEGQTKLDKLVDKFKKGLSSSEQNGHATPKDPSRNDGVQGDDSSVGQGPGVVPQPGPGHSGGAGGSMSQNGPQTPPSPQSPGASGEVGKQGESPQVGDPRELKETIDKAKETLSTYMVTRLKKLDPSVFWFADLLMDAKKVVEEYKTKLEKASDKKSVEDLRKEAEGKIESLIVTHQNREKGNQPAPQPGGQAGGSMVVPPVTQTPPSTSPSPGQKATEAEKKKLQDLIRQGQEELKKLEDYLGEVNNYPELPDNDPDYKVQKKDIWNDSKDTAPKKIKVFKEQIKNKTYTEKSLKDAVDDFIYYQIHAQIETMTRKIATYRKKHPNVAEVERLFSEKLKQTANSTYATLEGEALKTYFERDFLPVFNKIHSIIEELEKKSNQGESNKQDKVAEAQKKVVEAEKKAKIQKEEDSRNYPTNTSKTIELEIAEAQVGVAKAELELAQAQAQTPQDTDKINTAKAKVETAKSKVKTLEKIKAGHGRPQVGDQKPSMPAPDTKPAGDKRPSSEPTPTPQPEGKQPSTPKEPENKKPSLPSPEKPKNSKIFTATDGKTKVTVMFEHSVDVGKVNIKEVISKDLVATITHKAGGGVVRVFELFLSKNGKETHVNGERTVRLTLGQTGSGVQVYHVKENGELELLPSTVENGQVVFKTSHFSLFAIKTLPKKQMVVETEANREGKTQSDDKEMILLADKANQMSENRSNSDKKDKQLPSTGTMSTLPMEFLGLISLVGVYLLKGKKTEND